MQGLGLKAGARALIISENRPEFLIAELAALRLGAAASFGYMTGTEGDFAHLLRDCEPAVVFLTPNEATAGRFLAAHGARTVRTADAHIKQAPPAVIFLPPLPGAKSEGNTGSAGAESTEGAGGAGGANGADGAQHLAWAQALHEGRAALKAGAALPPVPQDGGALACICYTSGTSLEPRGVMLSHANLLANARAAAALVAEVHGGTRLRMLSFLPMSHIYEHTAGQLLPIAAGGEIGYIARREELLPAFAEFRPTLALAVPRFYDLLLRRMEQAAASAGGLRRFLFTQAMRCGRRAAEGRSALWERPWNACLEARVRSAVRARFGGRLIAFVSGGGALAPETGEKLTALGLSILQGYGQTETSPVVSTNWPGRKIKLHSAGEPIAGAEVRIAADGEILVSGPFVMQGYWRRANETAEVLGADGWLRTGDFGHLDEDGHLVISGRKRELMVLSGGENVPPTRPEAALSAEPEIDQAMATGDGRAHISALIVPSETFLAELGLAAADMERAEARAAAEEALGKAVARANQRLRAYERVRRWRAARCTFTPENGLLTPTFKLRRARIAAACAEELAELEGAEREERAR